MQTLRSQLLSLQLSHDTLQANLEKSQQQAAVYKEAYELGREVQIEQPSGRHYTVPTRKVNE